ncbi:hypothetical protein CU098_009671 [Rhizopus stolonifer]|uniref:Uncharacterized protein n=1 Tax=Rhizopus stolonifer TaxID=4846 RepID=A0A367K232_RHIST|nr:hypothetical protein CU098_009671 [Rhizopus stolonifer]
MRAVIVEKLNSAIIQYSNFACMLSFMSHVIMINFTIATTDTDVNAIHNVGQMKFSGSDYDLKTVSVTAEISPEVFNSYLSHHNKLHLESPL